MIEPTKIRMPRGSVLWVVKGAAIAALLSGNVAAVQSAPTKNARGTAVERLAGWWRLVSRVTTGPDGKVLTDPGLSATPSGFLVYDRFGHVAAQLSRLGRTVEMLGEECHAAERARGTSNNSQTVLGYDAYFGTYTVDEEAGVVTHHIEGALFPGDIGKALKRHFTLSGDALTIKYHIHSADGTPVERTLEWARVK